MTPRFQDEGFRTERPTSKRDNWIRLGAALACFATAGCLGAPLRVAPDAGAGPAVAGASDAPGGGGGNAGFFSDPDPPQVGGAGGIDAGGNAGAAGCAAPNPNDCAYPDEHAPCSSAHPAQCVNGGPKCPFGVTCTPDKGSENDAPDGGDADALCLGITISTSACATGAGSPTPAGDATSLRAAIAGAWTKCEGSLEASGGQIAAGQIGLLINALGGVAQIPTDGAAGETLGTVNALSATSPSCAAQESPFVGGVTYSSVTWSFTQTAFGAGARFEFQAGGATYDIIDLPAFSADGKRMTLTGELWAGTYVLTEAL